MLAPEAGIILACHHQRRKNNTNYTLRWVKGHQDDDKSDHDLDNNAKINKAMDLLAKEECKTGQRVDQQPYDGSGAMLKINNTWIITNYRQHIQEAVMSKQHLKFFLNNI